MYMFGLETFGEKLARISYKSNPPKLTLRTVFWKISSTNFTWTCKAWKDKCKNNCQYSRCRPKRYQPWHDRSYFCHW